MILASQILRRAGVLLMDDANVRWTLAELADWLDEGIAATVAAKPAAATVTMNFKPAKGTRQKLPDDQRIVQLLDVVRNLDVNIAGAAGRMIRPTTRSQIDTQQPRWHDPSYVPFQAEARQFIFDELQPREFYLFPGNTGTGLVEIVVSQLPQTVSSRVVADPTLLTSYNIDVGLPDEYQPPLLDYVLYRAHGKEDLAADSNKSTTHYQVFATSLGIISQVEVASSPNRKRP